MNLHVYLRTCSLRVIRSHNPTYPNSHTTVTQSANPKTMSTEDFLQEQSRQYQRHLAIRNTTRQVLQHQHEIRTHKTIPKQYLPQKSLQLTEPNATLTSEYEKKLHDLIFQHLDNVITHNTISSELAEAQMRQLIRHTEKQLAILKTTSATIAQYHHQFVTNNNIDRHDVHPDLLKHLPHSPATPTIGPSQSGKPTPPPRRDPQPQRNTKKRKRPRQHQRRNADKKLKQTPPTTLLSPSQSPSAHPPTPPHFLETRTDTNFPT